MSNVGRRKKEDSKKYTICVRLSEEELNVLDDLCFRSNMSKSELIRDALDYYKHLASYWE